MAWWVKIYQSMTGWRWYKDKNMKCLWLHLLLTAEHEDKIVDNDVVERGALYTSLSTLAREVGLTMREVRTCLKRLVGDKQVTYETTKKGTKITICNYESYQDARQSGRQSGRQTSDTPVPDSANDTFSFFYNESKSIKKEGDIKISPKKESQPDTPYDEILKLWNENAKRNIPKVRMLSQARKDKVRLRIKEMGGIEEAMKTLPECFKKIADSDFCNGSSGKWTATWDWFFDNDKNWVKVLEGNYDNRQAKSRVEQLAELSQKGHEFYSGQRYGYGGSSPYGNPQGGGDDGPDEQ